MGVNNQILLEVFNRAKERFYETDKDLILSGVSERALCGRLAIYLELLLPEYGFKNYFSDTEYNRKQNGEIKTILNDEYEIIKITCDLIVHSRGKVIENDNLIAIEMKKSDHLESEKTKDRNRLRALTKSSYDDVWSVDGETLPEHVCGYNIGIYMELDYEEVSWLYELYQEGKLIRTWKENF